MGYSDDDCTDCSMVIQIAFQRMWEYVCAYIYVCMYALCRLEELTLKPAMKQNTRQRCSGHAGRRTVGRERCREVGAFL